jgi:hypothetical protein
VNSRLLSTCGPNEPIEPMIQKDICISTPASLELPAADADSPYRVRGSSR